MNIHFPKPQYLGSGRWDSADGVDADFSVEFEECLVNLKKLCYLCKYLIVYGS